VCRIDTNALTTLVYALPAARTIVGAGYRVYFPDLPAASRFARLFEFTQASTSFTVWVDSTGAVFLNTVQISAGPVIGARSWFHIEAKADLVSSPGNVKVDIRVEGVPVASTTLPTTAPIISVNLAPTSSSGVVNLLAYIKDVVIWDSLGSFNNNFMGPVVVVSMNPQSDNTAGGWTPSIAGPLTAMVDNRPPLDGTEFITAPFPLPAPCAFETVNLPADVSSVRGVKTFIRARKVDGGDAQVQVSMVSGASTASGANRPVTPTFTYWSDVFEVDPVTSAPWTLSAINASKLKIDRTV
jgi:hypothetical protein